MRIARNTRLVATGYLRISRQHAAEILGPRAVDDAAEDHVADAAGAQLLRLGRSSKEGVDLALGEELERRDGRVGAGHPVDVLARIEPNVRSHCDQEGVRVGSRSLNADSPAP